MTGRAVGLKIRRKHNLGFMRQVQPDEKLSAVIGREPLPRSELTKRLWNYIQKNGLQDKHKKCLIHADNNLKAVFNGKAQVNMFEMNQLVKGHLLS
jgi:chromatin remodeling complex protein RSC6